jgi:hypothetical protein
MGFHHSLSIERYQNPKSKNTVLAMGNVFSSFIGTVRTIFA